MGFKVIDILDGETIQVSPNWSWTTLEGKKLVGGKLKIKGYTLPQANAYPNYAIDKLRKLLLNREVVLKNPELINNIGNDNISCNVFIDNVDVSNYFPEYRH